MDQLLVFNAMMLLFGITLTFAFSGLSLNKQNVLAIFGLFALCILLQQLFDLWFGECFVLVFYPLITHLPLILTLYLFYHKRPSIAMSALATAYLFCQPSRWMGFLVSCFTQNLLIVELWKYLTLIAAGMVSLFWLSGIISQIFSSGTRGVLVLGGLPITYYLFDYVVGVYGDFWPSTAIVLSELTPFLLCVVYVCYCLVYYIEYERRADAERNERVIRFTVEQQTREMEAILRSERETRILRHDMRLFLNNLSLCLDSDPDTARRMIASYSESVENASVKRYCANTVINCVLSNFAALCQEAGIDFQIKLSLTSPFADEIMFASILSNALDNALNAQKALSKEKRFIRLMLKDTSGRLLLSISNPFVHPPVFVDGMPVSSQKGHGYGTQSIRMLTERMGGKCQFLIENDLFVFRLVL